MWQRKYFRTKNKNNRELREMSNATKFKGSENMLTETFIITLVETYLRLKNVNKES